MCHLSWRLLSAFTETFLLLSGGAEQNTTTLCVSSSSPAGTAVCLSVCLCGAAAATMLSSWKTGNTVSRSSSQSQMTLLEHLKMCYIREISLNLSFPDTSPDRRLGLKSRLKRHQIGSLQLMFSLDKPGDGLVLQRGDVMRAGWRSCERRRAELVFIHCLSVTWTWLTLWCDCVVLFNSMVVGVCVRMRLSCSQVVTSGAWCHPTFLFCHLILKVKAATSTFQQMYVYFAFYIYFNVWAFWPSEMTKRDNCIVINSKLTCKHRKTNWKLIKGYRK